MKKHVINLIFHLYLYQMVREFLIKQVLISIAMEHLNLLPTLVILYLYVLIVTIIIRLISISLLNVQTGRLFLYQIILEGLIQFLENLLMMMGNLRFKG